MKTKSDIVANWLPRYTGTPAKDFSKYVLLVNFTQYVNLFAEWHGVEVRGRSQKVDLWDWLKLMGGYGAQVRRSSND